MQLRSGYEYHSSILSCPVLPHRLTPYFPCLFFTSLSSWCTVFTSVSFLELVHIAFFLVCAHRLFSLHVRTTLPYGSCHMFISDYIFIQDSIQPSQHRHLIHLQSSFLGFSLLTMSLLHSSMLALPLFCRTTLHCKSSKFLILHSPCLNIRSSVLLHHFPRGT